jgi:hypothetical protein
MVKSAVKSYFDPVFSITYLVVSVLGKPHVYKPEQQQLDSLFLATKHCSWVVWRCKYQHRWYSRIITTDNGSRGGTYSLALPIEPGFTGTLFFKWGQYFSFL